jgi:UDP-N-acetylmuramoyl-tripeptide--D-alanyl-D-alanine ligase
MKIEQLYARYKESAGISTDSRTIQKGQMFFALWGNKYNANLYASEALEKGASCAVIDDPAYETDKTILVDDCLFELQALASHHRKELKAQVLAITGTNGKTTTKELIAAIMSSKLKVHYTKGNLNNHIGVPLTILSAHEGTELMIIEMGANHIGEIRTLCLIAAPDYGIITNIGTAHIEGFGSSDGIVKTKIELFEYLKKVNGIAIYNDKDPLLTEKIFKIVNRAVPFSDPTGTDLIFELLPSDLKLTLSVEYHHQKHVINSNLFGKHNLENVRAAVATGLFLGVSMKDIITAVEKYVPGNNRSQIIVTNDNTLICDSYNANPDSMSKALESFFDLKIKNKVLILGDMLELGDKTQEEHIKILKKLKSVSTENVFLVGTVFGSLAQESGYRSFRDVEALRNYIKSNPLKGNYILVKGSRGIMLEKVYDLL